VAVAVAGIVAVGTKVPVWVAVGGKDVGEGGREVPVRVAVEGRDVGEGGREVPVRVAVGDGSVGEAWRGVRVGVCRWRRAGSDRSLRRKSAEPAPIEIACLSDGSAQGMGLTRG
jgi:hypothetical protein